MLTRVTSICALGKQLCAFFFNYKREIAFVYRLSRTKSSVTDSLAIFREHAKLAQKWFSLEIKWIGKQFGCSILLMLRRERCVYAFICFIYIFITEANNSMFSLNGSIPNDLLHHYWHQLKWNKIKSEKKNKNLRQNKVVHSNQANEATLLSCFIFCLCAFISCEVHELSELQMCFFTHQFLMTQFYASPVLLFHRTIYFSVFFSLSSSSSDGCSFF